MKITEKASALNLPFGKYVIIGSGIMDALGIRTAEDIDIAVLPELHQVLIENGEWEQEVRYGHIHLKKEGVEITPDLPWHEYATTTQEAINSATVIDGIPFMNLDELKKFKTALGREKDYRDIDLINQYLMEHEPSAGF